MKTDGFNYSDDSANIVKQCLTGQASLPSGMTSNGQAVFLNDLDDSMKVPGCKPQDLNGHCVTMGKTRDGMTRR